MKTLREILRRSESDEDEPPPPGHEHCLSCNADLKGSRSYERFRVCHSCGFHFHLTAIERVATLLDPGSFAESDRGVTATEASWFTGKQGYRGRVIRAQRRTGLSEAALTGTGAILGRDVVLAVLDFSFLGGSIGVAAGERLARAFEKAAARRVPLISVCSTSGTRMQEGILALMQVPRVAAAARRLQHSGMPHVAVATDPTTGSAYSGFVNLADYLIAEPNALIGYAALRVLQEQAAEDLPPGAHTSESHLAHGLVDAVVARPQLRDYLALLLDLIQSDFRLSADGHGRAGRVAHTQRGALQQLQLSRHSERPGAADFITRMTTSFIPIRGDRTGEDDASIMAGFASLGGDAVMIIGQVRARAGGPDGLIRAAGFRKATRALGLAGRFGLPVVTLIDTEGAHPGLASEQQGLGHAIAHCTAAMLDLPVPTVAVIIGEGNSEAAVALAVADRVLMLDNAVYEVVRPEDAAKMLFGGADRTGEAAERLRITSHDCLRLGIADVAVPEPGEGAHTNHQEAAQLVQRAILRELTRMERLRPKRRLEHRYERYRQIGSTHSWLRGTLDRRLSHLRDRLGGAIDRLRGRSSLVRRRVEFGEHPDIPF